MTQLCCFLVHRMYFVILFNLSI